MEGPEIQGHVHLHREFEANLGYMRPGPGMRERLNHMFLAYSLKRDKSTDP